jgi:hypothetical protein
VYWDAASCRERAQVVWASQSAAEQRAGRTGRTCAGFCYRLLPRAAFFELDRWAGCCCCCYWAVCLTVVWWSHDAVVLGQKFFWFLRVLLEQQLLLLG